MSQQIFTTCNPIAINCFLYTNSNRTTPVSAGYYYDGGTCWQVSSSGKVTAAGACNSVTIYSRAGDTLNLGVEYDLYYSSDNVNWSYLAGPLNSTSCTTLSTVNIGSGNIYIKALNSSNNAQIYINGANTSTCPSNNPVDCVYNAAIGGPEDVAITVYVTSGDFQNC